MTTHHHNGGGDLDSMDRAVADAQQILRRRIETIETAKDEQPGRLAKARADAEQARIWAGVEEPFHTQVQTITSTDGNASVSLPNITAKELLGARMAFDLLDAGLQSDDDPDVIEDVKSRYFSDLQGDTGLLFLVCMAALDTVCSLVVPQMVDELEERASNYDVRVMLAEARTKSWNGRVAELRGPHDHAGGGVPGPDGVL